MTMRGAGLGMAGLLLVGGAGCDPNDEVLLGRQQAAKISDCDAGDCDGGQAPVSPAPVSPAVSGVCDVAIEGTLPVELHVDMAEQLCPAADADCRVELLQMIGAPDGSVWVRTLLGALSVPFSTPSTVIAHFSAEGRKLAQVLPTAWVDSLAVDELGNAWALAVGDGLFVAGGVTGPIQRFDSGGQPLGAPLNPTTPVVRLAASAGHGMAFAGFSSVGMLDLNGQVQWEEALDARVTGDLVASSDGVLVASTLGGPLYTVVLRQFDPQGQLIASAEAAVKAGFGPSEYSVSLRQDPDGNTLVAIKPPLLVPASNGDYFPNAELLDVERISPAGVSRFVVRLSSTLNVAFTALADGRTAVVEQRFGEPEGVVALVSANGQTCHRIGYAQVDENLTELTVSSTGQLWFAGADSIGRFGTLTP